MREGNVSALPVEQRLKCGGHPKLTPAALDLKALQLPLRTAACSGDVAHLRAMTQIKLHVVWALRLIWRLHGLHRDVVPGRVVLQHRRKQ
jgi:hypothetical protein